MTDRLDPRMPAPERCVLPLVLDGLARERPDDCFAIFENGGSWSYRDTRTRARQVASALLALGAARGDKVLLWLPNGELSLRCWFGTNWLGAVSVAINTAYRGNLLAHVITNSDAKLAICHPDLVERLLELEHRGSLETVLTTKDKVAELKHRFQAAGIRLAPIDLLDEPCDDLRPADLLPWDLQSICYTSGTTGPSKGVMSSYLHLHAMGWNCTDGVDANDRYLINLPLFHVGGTLFVTGALARGASIALLDQFATASFLETSRRLGATQCLLLGAMAGFLMRAPPSRADRGHRLRRVMVIPLGEDASAMRDRFGFDVVTLFNMSEISAPIVSDLNPSARGSCGRLRPGYDARLVDDNDCEVPDGTSGELVLRADCPWTMSHGYYKMPEATAKAWRNGWFHTGDVFRRDEAGNYYFVDRAKDAIRRRGENISSFEVESEALAYPGIAEVAAVGVPSSDSEEEVLLVVVPKVDVEIEPRSLIEFLIERLPHFMVPRYLRFTDALPKTPTSKVEKHRLRADGCTADTWDREAAGIKVKRQRLN